MRLLEIDIFVRVYSGGEKPAGVRLTFGEPVSQDGQEGNMNLSLNVGQKVPYVVNEIDINGNIVAPGTGDTCTVSLDFPALASIVPDTQVAPGSVASGFLVAGAPAATSTVTIFAQAFNAAGAAIGPVASVAVDVVPAGAPVPVAAGAIITLGVPVAQ